MPGIIGRDGQADRLEHLPAVAWNPMKVRIGIDGLSAYEVAVAAGFEGTRDEWLRSLSAPALDAAAQATAAADCAGDAALAATAAAAEAGREARAATEAAASANEAVVQLTGFKESIASQVSMKADLDSAGRYVLPSQLDPLQGLQTGADTSGGYYKGASASLLSGGDRTTELLFTAGADVTTPQCVFSMRGGPSFVVRVTGGTLYIVYGVASFTQPIQSGTTCHVVIGRGYVQVNGIQTIVAETDMSPSTALFWGRNYDDANLQPFCGVVHRLRVFNYSLSGAGALALWNGGRPAERFLPVSGLGGRAYARFTPSYDAAGLGRYHSLPVSAGNDYLDGLVPGETYLLRFTNQSAVTVRAVFGATYLKNGVRTFYRDYTGSIAATGKTSELVLTIDGTLGLNDGRITPTVYAVANEPIGTVALRNVEVVKLGCVAEYLPCGLLPTLWRDTSGSGADLTASGAPQYSYRAAANYGPDFPLAGTLEELCSYGIEWDTAASSPACRRIGNMALHRSLPIQSRMRGCLLDDDGAVARYLDASDWTAETRDGTAGQVMVEIPAHYRRFESEGAICRVHISEMALPGYHYVPRSYISAYEAALERSTGKLCSVVNRDANYRGGDNNASWDGTYRTLLGRPVTMLSRTEFRAAARKRNASTVAWNCCDYNVYKSVFWLYMVEYADRNSQLSYTALRDASGCPQGGLGDGVTTLTVRQWSDYNSYYPFVPCGHTDALGNGSGEVAYAVPTASGTLATVYVNRYRGIENPFGHIWKWTDGINVEVKSNADGGTSKVYVADNPALYSDNGYEGYRLVGGEARSEGFAKNILMGGTGEIVPSAVGGSSSTCWCDTHFTEVGSSSLRGAMLGGIAIHGASAGLACFYTNYDPSRTNAGGGSRLCYVPWPVTPNVSDDE